MQFGDFLSLLGLPKVSPDAIESRPCFSRWWGFCRFGRGVRRSGRAGRTGVGDPALVLAIRRAGDCDRYGDFAGYRSIAGRLQPPWRVRLFLILFDLPRDNVKAIVSEISILHRLPALDRYLSVGPSVNNGVSAAKAGVRHLQAGGASPCFPGGIVDPDPAFMPGAVESWNDGRRALSCSSPRPRDAGCRRDRQRRPVARLVQQPGHPVA